MEHRLKIQKELPLSRQTVINIFLLNNWIKTDITLVLKPYELSIEQFNVLRILRGQNSNPINLQDIQNRMVSKMSNTTRLIDKLIKKDFVKRIQCAENRRKIEIYITNSGIKILNAIDPLIDQSEEDITSNLSDHELQELNKLLLKLKK